MAPHRKTTGAKGRGKSGGNWKPEQYFAEHAPNGKYCNINGLPEKGCEGKACRCNDMHVRVCKAHPSRVKVRTGFFLTEKCGDGTRRRAEWALKALVEAGEVEIDETVVFRVNKFTKRS